MPHLLDMLLGGYAKPLLEFISILDATELRTTCVAARDAVRAHPWGDDPAFLLEGDVHGYIGRWWACFPRATALRLAETSELGDDDAAYFAGLRTVSIPREELTEGISDDFLEMLEDADSLDISAHVGINGNGFEYLASLRSLTMHGCGRVYTDALTLLPHPEQLRELRIMYTNIDDSSLAPLTALRTLDARGAPRITMAGV